MHRGRSQRGIITSQVVEKQPAVAGGGFVSSRRSAVTQGRLKSLGSVDLQPGDNGGV
jgi:hypothetical protein